MFRNWISPLGNILVEIRNSIYYPNCRVFLVYCVLFALYLCVTKESYHPTNLHVALID
jgi:hypothetical protein